MGIIDQMLGKWKMVPESAKNFDTFAAAMKFSPEVIAKIKYDRQHTTVELTRDGDVFTLAMDINGQGETMTFQLGQEFTSKSFGFESKNVFRENGDELLGEHVVGDQKATSRRILKDGQLVVESTGNGVTETVVLKRC